GFAVVATEVRNLSEKTGALNKLIHKSVSAGRSTVQETNEIVGKLASLDMNHAVEAKGNLDNMIKDLDKVNNFVTKSLGTSSGIVQSIQSDIGQALTGLQYEDIATQLIAHVKTRLDALEKGMQLMTPLLHQNELAPILQTINATLNKQIDENSAAKRAVASTSMEHGDIEFF
ncbi:MAG: hypothetical protein KAI17_13455, partial [Thiotrichaceae bacterium]|nr:hypothetical protein [Thiotrichaceae bacterium]